jgi:hypothetical protein
MDPFLRGLKTNLKVYRLCGFYATLSLNPAIEGSAKVLFLLLKERAKERFYFHNNPYEVMP